MILGAILAGGHSTRFGSDKAHALWNGVPLIDHVAVRLTTVAQAIVVCGRDHDGIPSITDRPGPGLGPLAGLNAALHHARALGLDHVITIPCDTPLLSASLLEALAGGAGDAFLADMPVIGRWRSAAATLLDAHIKADGTRSMRAWAQRIDACPLDHLSPPNINRPTDLEALRGC
jgi:molybdopterin-guanine dinucleotide biosynthesis protein A